MTERLPKVLRSRGFWHIRTGQSHRSLRRLGCLGMALLMVGCAAEPELKPAPTSRFIQAKPAQDAAVPAANKLAKVTPKPSKPRVYPEPTILDGLSASKVVALLGAPGFKRTDDPAEIWQYRAANCTLDLFMYEMLDSEQRTVTHYETRPQQGKSMSPKDCFIAIIQTSESASQKS